MGARPVLILTPTQCPAGSGARLDSVLCSPGHHCSRTSVAWRPSSRGLSVSPHRLTGTPPPTRGFFQRPLALGPHTFSVLGVSEVMDMPCLLDGLGEPDAPVQPTAPRAQGGEQGLSSFIH